jgi:arylsulfatase A-like enzyme
MNGAKLSEPGATVPQQRKQGNSRVILLPDTAFGLLMGTSRAREADMTRRSFLGASGALFSNGAPSKGTQERKPNVLLIMADQHRAGLTRRSGYALDTMPALDSLADRGLSFDLAYTTAPLCVPARVSMLTGRWPHAHRVRENAGAKHAFFEQDLFDICKALGYRRGLVGKNHSHLGPDKMDYFRPYSHNGALKPTPVTPDEAKFDAWLTQLNHGVGKQPTPFPVELQLPYRIVSHALEFLKETGDQPFLLWVSFPEPHNPYQVPKPYFDMFPPESVPSRCCGPEVLQKKSFKWRWLRGLQEATYPGYDDYWQRTKSNYLGMLRLIDDQLARLFRYMDERGLWENTIVVYVSDHGDYLTDYGLMRKGVGLPEALVRIPMVWAGYGIQARAADRLFVSLADVMPTLCEALGAEIPRGTQGRSLWPLLRGQPFPREEFRSVYAEVGFGGLHYDERDNLPYSIAQGGPTGAPRSFDELNPCTQSGYTKMVRMGSWKLVFDMLGNGELYNLEEDPYELDNRYGRPEVAGIQMQLLEELLAWTIRTQDTLPTARYAVKWASRGWYAPYRRRP